MDISNQAAQNQQPRNKQNQEQILKEQILNQKCPFHEKLQLDLLHLNGSATRHRMCIQCVQKNKIPISEILSIEQLLSADQNTLFPAFPVLTDPDINSYIENETGSVEELVKKVDEYFIGLKAELEKAIDNARSRTKIALSKLSESYCKMIDSHKQVSKIKEFQTVFLNYTNNNTASVAVDNSLHQYILKHCQESAANTQLIQSHLESFKKLKNQFQINSFQAAQSQLLQIINNIEFFGNVLGSKSLSNGNLSSNRKSLVNSVSFISQQEGQEQPIINLVDFNCLPCINYEQSAAKLKIQKEQQFGSSLITHKGEKCDSQFYLDQELQKDQRYILRLEIIHNNYQTKKYGFEVGVVQESFKETAQTINDKMSYCECKNGEGIDTVVKGGQLHTNPTSKVKRILEFRIHLASKYLRAASLPDYASVVKLDDSSKIKGDKKYYIGIYIGFPEDQIRILQFLKVSQFDNKMD